jgi:hypothetical protein
MTSPGFAICFPYTLAPMTAYSRFAPIWITAAVLIFAPSAQAMIQVDAGIAGARLGATRDQVRAALGKPIKIRTLKNDFGPYVEYRFSGGIRVTFQGKTNVTAVTTTGKSDLTTGAIGVGSTENQVQASVKGVKCEGVGTARSCHTGEFKAGKTVTDFRIENGSVTSVTVGIVID